MDSKISVFLILISGFTVTACGKSDPKPSDSNTFPTQTLYDAQQLASQAIAHCTDPSQCSPSVGMLIGTTQASAYQCTAFLIAPDTVATNSHCIPDDLKRAGASCQDRIALVFPGFSQYTNLTTGCDHVISASTITDASKQNPDYAFIRLDTSVDRPTVQITRSGLSDGTTYTIDKMDPYQGNGIPEGYLHQATCKAVYNSVIETGGKTVTTATSPVLALADCDVIHGNSGSPVFDSNGNVPAIVFATIEPKEMNAQARALLLDSNIAQMGLATNYACQSVPSNAIGSVPLACSLPAGNADATEASIVSQTTQDLNSKFEDAKPSLDPFFKWKSVQVPGWSQSEFGFSKATSSTDFLVVAVPDCVQDVSGLLASETESFGRYPDSADKLDRIPVWSARFGLNHYLQLTYEVNEAQPSLENQMAIRFSPKTLAKNGTSKIEVSDSSNLTLGQPLYSGILSICK